MPSLMTVKENTRGAAGSTSSHGWMLAGCVGDQAGLSQVPVAKLPFSIGRDPSNDLRLDSKLVSKRHAELIATSRTVLVRDLGSTNGTFVNGRRIFEAKPIDQTDLVQFANCEFRVDRQQTGSDAHTAVDYSLEDFWLFSRMQEVIDDGRLRMAYQPIVMGPNAVPVGYEALVRADVPGWTSPVELFDAAVKLGVEKRLSAHCRAEAVKTLKDVPLSGTLFVNTHPHECLGPELIQSLAKLQKEADGRRLVLEIHEEAVPDLSAMQEFRAALHDLDIGLAYDDFGIGKSRLLELAQAPPDYLKFDRALVKDLGSTSASQTALVRTLHHHAEDLGIITLAEGLDSQSAFEACRDIGFTHFQGFLFGRPQFAAEILGLSPAKATDPRRRPPKS
ncbi:MAG: EAL domain-containing protein, partial [Planctomycetaceae bacterium]|nr:EAL domain-containing protein [Planctomycetaceae bacterium]